MLIIHRKGQNFAIACEQYGEADKITLLQFIGGRNGAYVQNYLCEKGIHQVTGMSFFVIVVAVEKSTRQCTTLLDGRSGEMTELIVIKCYINGRSPQEEYQSKKRKLWKIFRNN